MIDVFDPKEIARKNRFAMGAALIALLFVLVSDNLLTGGYRLIGGLAFLALAIFGFQSIFYSSTLVAFRVQGKALRFFQVTIALAFPAILTSYFYFEAAMIDLSYFINKFSSIWALLPIVILFYLGRAGARVLHSTYPFRGYLIAAAVMFVPCFMWAQGYYFQKTPDGESSYLGLDPESKNEATTTGIYVVQYPLYVGLLYVGMLSQLLLPRKKPPPVLRF